MKHWALVVMAAISLAGCQASKPIEQMSYSESKALAAELHKRCAAQGFPQGDPEFNACMKQEINREASVRNEAYRRANSTVICTTVGYTVICG